MSIDLAARIKAARERKGWTQQDLADAVGVTRGSVRNWESGTEPKSSLARIEDALGVSLSRDNVAPPGDDADGVLLDLPEDAYSDLEPAEREEAIAAAKAAFLERARKIRGSR